ncbi:hypothetical protein HX792_08420 [Pseudomonas sp. B6002]|uniref:hypothetical protein n=1 Tax=Pseudomonas sp. B6002 TaxID=2726978 RepID=UPI0015A154D1|nr:hypothetical protein [Pseudomonas sp. B6002]NVZ50353.1 hypothetical protein [Pseudomonas sp. B6002]
MKRTFTAFAFLLLLSLASIASADIPASPAARAFIAKQHMGKNLQQFAQLAARTTVTYAMVAEKIGPAGARKALDEQITQLLPKYQPQWDLNLAEAYQQSFTDEEMASLAAEGQASKYASKVTAKQQEVSDRMKAKSTPILKALITDALAALMPLGV